MIPINFDYYRPATLSEAVNAYGSSNSPLYYGGGSEIISMSRVGSIAPGAVIDLKNIPECNVLSLSKEELIIGSALSLYKIYSAKHFPLLDNTIKRIADHTNQCRITIGGNVSGTVIYRESVLPLLVSDAEVLIFSYGKMKRVNINSIFSGRISLSPGEFIVQFIINNKYLNLPHIHVKKTKNEKIDYPLLTVAALKENGNIRAAFSGICGFPFRSYEIENTLNSDLSIAGKVEKICAQLPAPALSNIAGKSDYKMFVLKNTMKNILTKIGEM